MANKTALECTDQLLRHITKQDTPFGGKIFVGLGDFRQVAPVVRRGGPSAILNASVKSSYLWQFFECLRLYQPIRDSGDPIYSTWVDSIGEGSQTQHISYIDMQDFLQFTSYGQAIDFLFPIEVLLRPEEAIKRSYLSPYNMAVDEFNDKILENIPQEECKY